jgi:Stealth protein CR2, conserved region 2/Stealth protein CR1, conserved region 1/Stealth protein CR3, conserved region 3
MKYFPLCCGAFTGLTIYICFVFLVLHILLPINVDPPFIVDIETLSKKVSSIHPNFTLLEKVDLVYTSVNGSDPLWLKEFRRYEGEEGYGYYNKYRSWQELRYSLRSVEMYMSWVNHIFIVVSSSSQIPYWLNTTHPRITIILHAEIGLDTISFNSNVIESRLHYIPGLSENFIYMNNDLFLSSEITKEDFISNHAEYIEYSDWSISRSVKCERWYQKLNFSETAKIDQKMFATCLKSNYFLYETILIYHYFAPSSIPHHWFCHMPHFYNRYVLFELEQKLLPFFKQSLAHNRFRNKKTDLNLYILYVAFLKTYHSKEIPIKTIILSKIPSYLQKDIYYYTLLPDTETKFQKLEKVIDYYHPKFIGIEDDLQQDSYINVTQVYFPAMMKKFWYLKTEYEI